MALVKKSDSAGSVLYSGDVASMRYKVYSRSAGADVIAWTSLTVANVLAANSGALDSAGNNLNVPIPATAFPDGDKLYRVIIEITLNAVSGFTEIGRVVVDLTSVSET